jgi:putative Mg2+ transporter-C (MgtC) family protein
MTPHEYADISLRMLLAVSGGGLIGFERTYHGRPAGFRTHTLVCTASALLMLLTVYQWELLVGAPIETLRVDPTRMAQGIMTGIGFLGAGVIMKEGLSIRGLTTAASIWITASIGIMVGIGFYFAAALATALTLGVLSLFRWIEAITPSLHYARLNVRFRRGDVMAEHKVHDLVQAHSISAANPIYSLEEQGQLFQYQMTMRTRHTQNYRRLAETLTQMPEVLEFQITPTGD